MPRYQRGRGTVETPPRPPDQDDLADPDFKEEEEEETSHGQDQGEPAPEGAELSPIVVEALAPLTERLAALEKRLERPAAEVDLARKTVRQGRGCGPGRPGARRRRNQREQIRRRYEGNSALKGSEGQALRPIRTRV